MRYGFVEEAQRIAYGLFEAADCFSGRLPELFCGLDRASYRQPVPYPASCSPQAWASAAPIHLIRTLMRFDPALPWKELWLAPELPAGFGQFRVDNVPFAGNSRLRIDIEKDSVTVAGLPDDVRLRLEARPALSDLLNLTRMRPAGSGCVGGVPPRASGRAVLGCDEPRECRLDLGPALGAARQQLAGQPSMRLRHCVRRKALAWRRALSLALYTSVM